MKLVDVVEIIITTLFLVMIYVGVHALVPLTLILALEIVEVEVLVDLEAQVITLDKPLEVDKVQVPVMPQVEMGATLLLLVKDLGQELHRLEMVRHLGRVLEKVLVQGQPQEVTIVAHQVLAKDREQEVLRQEMVHQVLQVLDLDRLLDKRVAQDQLRVPLQVEAEELQLIVTLMEVEVQVEQELDRELVLEALTILVLLDKEAELDKEQHKWIIMVHPLPQDQGLAKERVLLVVAQMLMLLALDLELVKEAPQVEEDKEALELHLSSLLAILMLI